MSLDSKREFDKLRDLEGSSEAANVTQRSTASSVDQ